MEHVDVLIVGAGLSGIGAAYHLQRDLPGKSYAILESRDAIGGTWDIFRYPGIRSDSDMHTLGYRFKPWIADEAIADGPAILDYVRETAAENRIDPHIRFHHRVVSADWSSPDARWTVEALRTDTEETVKLTCSFLYMCSGYYNYEHGYEPEFPGRERFGGQIVHPQFWPEDLDYAGKQVVVIGSGATAVTLVPAMASKTAHITMLQRSPTYIVSLPAKDVIANTLRKYLPNKAAYSITRWKNVLIQMAMYQLSKRRPKVVKAIIRKGQERDLPAGYAIDTHFKPKYNPWDQRMCIVPNGDLFDALRDGSASIATDTIDTFDETGIKLASGEHLDADIIVTATGLDMLALGGITLSKDGTTVDIPGSMAYKAMMLSDVPNFAFTIGYTNASWTLKADLTSEYVVRVLKHLDASHTKVAMPKRDPAMGEVAFMDSLTSGYVLRALDRFPKSGAAAPWRVYMNYARDVPMIRFGSLEDGAMTFSNPAPVREQVPA